MRPLLDMETIQIEITNACHHQCSNCTRLCGHYSEVYFMPVAEFRAAVESLRDFPRMVGMMGGEPLLHPQFPELCAIMRELLPPERCGLWTCLPGGKERYREEIAATFGHIFLNDHSRDDILHGPILVASGELPFPQWEKDVLINSCWVQNSWSASINPKGAWFCEVAGAIANLLGEYDELAWEVKPGWWRKSPKDFVSQMTLCDFCGAAMPLLKRISTENVDDLSPWWLSLLQDSSPKVRAGRYVPHDLQVCLDTRPVAAYKDQSYRDAIARRYGLFLMTNEQGYLTPYLSRTFTGET